VTTSATESTGATERVLIELDERRRASLGKVGRHRRYLAHEEPNGVIVLIPAVVLTETEARLLGRPDLVDQIERTAADPASRVRRGRPQRQESEG
jgi:hypothetical protein